MKIYDLLCAANHRFEGWFKSAADYSGQKKKGLLVCPNCGSDSVRRVPSVARVNLGAAEPSLASAPGSKDLPAEFAGKDPLAIAQMLYSRMVDEMLTKSEDVGSAFPEEARKIHYKETPARAIRGKASNEEHDALVEEGIPVARLPIPPSDQWN
jgi:hypothetical protein